MQDSFQHFLLVAPSGSGKTQRVIAPNVFHLAKSCSLVITDPKLELYRLSSGYLKNEMNCDVYVLNLYDISKSITWNPFKGIKYSEVQKMMTQLYDIVQSNQQSESIWKFGAIDILTTLGKTLLTYNSGRYLNFKNLYYLVNTLQVSPDLVNDWVKSNTIHQEVSLAFDRFLQSEDKIRNGMLSGAIATLIPYCSDEVLAVSSSHSFPNLDQFRKKKSVLFLALPFDSSGSFAPYITLFMSQFLGNLLTIPLDEKDLPIACIMEEFGNLRKIPSYPSLVATIRDKRVMLLHCLQNLDQLSEVYGTSGAEIIANNCTHWLILSGIKSGLTLKYITENLLGTTTSEEYDNQQKSTIIRSRPLFTKDEVRRLDKEYAIYISANNQPSLLRLKPLFKRRKLCRRYGLQRKQFQLISKHAQVEHRNLNKKQPILSLTKENESMIEESDFDALLKKHFPD